MPTITIPTREQVHAMLIPAGTTDGDVRVVDEIPSEHDAKMARLSAAFGGGGRGLVTPGEPIRTIYRGNTLWMSDTRDEWYDQLWFVRNVARRADTTRVLVTGLGLGMTPTALVLMGVREIDVVEMNATVCDLVGTHLAKVAADRGVTIRVHHADAYTWTPPKGQQWDLAWHDIWPFITSDNLPGMGKLRRKFAARMTAPQSQHCWAERECLRAKRHDRRWGW